MLQVQDGEQIAARYNDSFHGSKIPAVVTDTTCPGFFLLESSGIVSGL